MPISKSKLLAAIVAVVVLAPTTALATHVFDDVPDGAFYAGPVEWAFDNGITTGKSPTSFAPLDPVTRGESVTFLERYEDNIGAPRDASQQADIDEVESQANQLQAQIDESPRVHFAQVADDGTVENTSRAAIAVDREAVGSYRLTLPEVVSNCVVTASLFASTSPVGELPQWVEYREQATIFAIRDEGDDPNELRVWTYVDDAGTSTSTDMPFAVTATCIHPEGETPPSFG